MGLASKLSAAQGGVNPYGAPPMGGIPPAGGSGGPSAPMMPPGAGGAAAPYPPTGGPQGSPYPPQGMPEGAGAAPYGAQGAAAAGAAAVGAPGGPYPPGSFMPAQQPAGQPSPYGEHEGAKDIQDVGQDQGVHCLTTTGMEHHAQCWERITFLSSTACMHTYCQYLHAWMHALLTHHIYSCPSPVAQIHPSLSVLMLVAQQPTDH